MSKYRLIETLSDLKSVIKDLEKEKIIAADIEADSMFNFREKICLIQISSAHQNFVIDTLKTGDLTLLKSIFSNRKIQKVFHGADYDVRCLYRDFGIIINGLFDTEVACRFLGLKETGLLSVLKAFFNIDLDKKFQKKDWSQRPLPEAMIDYAAGDVCYLLPLADILAKALKKKGRLSWVKEECSILSNVRPGRLSGNEPLFLKFKGAGRLRPRTLAVLEELLLYRVKMAEKKDMPPFKIMSGNVLMNLARKKPVNISEVAGSGILSKKQLGMHGTGIASAVKRALSRPEKSFPRYPKTRAPVIKPSAQKRIKALKEWRNAVAKSLNIDPSMVLNKETMKAIAVQKPSDIDGIENIAGLKKWQRHQFGESVLEAIQNLS